MSVNSGVWGSSGIIQNRVIPMFETASVVDGSGGGGNSGSSSSNSGSGSPSPGSKPGTNPPSLDGDPMGDGKGGQPGQVSTVPNVPGGADHPGKGSTAVNTVAMKTFANNLLALVDPQSPLSQALPYLLDINIRPGGFSSAVNLASQVNGDNGLAGKMHTTIGQLINTVTEAADAVNKMANHYESIDKANGMTADQYNSYMSGVTGDVQTLTGGSGSNGGGNGGSGSNGGGNGGSGSGSKG